MGRKPFPREPFTAGMFASGGRGNGAVDGALVSRTYRCVLADPPWHHKTYSAKGITRRSPSHHYDTMSLAEIMEMPVKDLADTDCWLFLWTTWPHMEQAFAVIRSWGFKYSSDFKIWVKLNPKASDKVLLAMRDFHIGTGYTTRKNTEVLLLAKRGSPKRLARNVLELMVSPRRQHSRKPDQTFPEIERFCVGPRVELFSREPRPGWDAWGKETMKFAEPDKAGVSFGDEHLGPPAPIPDTPMFPREAA